MSSSNAPLEEKTLLRRGKGKDGGNGLSLSLSYHATAKSNF